MAQFFEIHPQNPQPRLIHQAVEIMRRGGVVVYPTDSSYAIGCHIGDKEALDRIRRIRKLDKDHNFTLVARDLSEISSYAKIDNEKYRLIKAYTPGPYTFILPATRQVPRRLQHPRRKTVGLRIPDSIIVQALLADLGEPILSSTLILADESLPMSDAHDIRERLQHTVELVIDGGFCGLEPTTVVEWVAEIPTVVRTGKGEMSAFHRNRSAHETFA
ncbi:MAG: L-threonylcarbamoyladenylate synthase [Gammaproteobacteria bacterium]|nr:L-threonylcarbamoyladenylate synthase [Gammaproteobacteria bacterium]